jgi:predicted nucleotidyltransferase component of viral defense system
MLNREIHETHLRRLLSLIYTNRRLKKVVAFKGGTALYMFYNLNRFSTDLDFNCLIEDLDTQAMNEILSDYEIYDQSEKFHTWFWLLSYQKTQMKIKIEISKRDFPDTYEIKELLGIPIKVMTRDCMFAHKLCAISDRKKLQNRDLYDTYFMLRNGFEIKEEIIYLRTKKSLKEYLQFLTEYIPKNLASTSILDGLKQI